jgi:MFS family permease
MIANKQEITPRAGSWAELLGKKHAPAAFVLAAGVALYATNAYLTASLLPTAVAEIGGERYYAWTTAFLISSVLAVTSVGTLVGAWGPRNSYLAALALFGFGTLICAASQSMAEMLLGRSVQGIGGGLLSGLGYATMRSALPERLWAYASGLVSAMWGVGTFLGPAAGGLFAQAHAWRSAFLALLAVTALTAAVTPFAFRGGPRDRQPRGWPSLLSSALLVGAELAASFASSAPSKLGLGLALAAAAVLATGFFWADSRAKHGVFPPLAYARGSALPWVYLVIGVLTVGTSVEIFIPLFGQRLGGLSPVAAGFFGALFALGWTLGEFPSVPVTSPRRVRAILVTGPLVTAAALVLAGSLELSSSRVLFGASVLIAGIGVGIVWPHLAVLVMRSAEDPDEGARAAAGISVAQLVAGTFGAALAGMLVNLAGAGSESAVRSLFYGIAPMGLIGFFGVLRALRRQT